MRPPTPLRKLLGAHGLLVGVGAVLALEAWYFILGWPVPFEIAVSALGLASVYAAIVDGLGAGQIVTIASLAYSDHLYPPQSFHDGFLRLAVIAVSFPTAAWMAARLGVRLNRVSSLEVQLGTEQALMQRIVSSVPVGLMYVDREARLRWANPQALAIADARGRPVNVGARFTDLFPDAKSNDHIRAALAGAGAVELPAVPLSLSGAQAYLDLSYLPVTGPHGRVDGVLIVAQDVTSRVRHDALQRERIWELQEIDRLKTDFINAASHELRTPLTSIVGYAEFLEDGVGGELADAQLAFVKQVQAGARRLRDLVDDLLDFARLEAGTFSLQLQEADLVATVREAIASLRPQALEARLELSLAAPEAIVLTMDPRRVDQVLLNLLRNAFKFSPRGACVQVVVLAHRDRVRVEVRDEGVGIASEHLDRLFDKFYQVDRSTTREHGGAGLGLAICKALVEAHGGTIGVQSTPGEGSTFWFELAHAPVEAEANRA